MLAQFDDPEIGTGFGIFGTLVWLVVVILAVAGMWKTFEKAGHPGWAAIIPFYNVWILLKIAGKPGWWLLLLFIPIVNLVFIFLVSIAVANAFGKGAGFGIGLALLGFIFYPLLGFGEDQYQGSPATA